MNLAAHPEIAVLAAVIEAGVGYPPALFSAIGHPVSWIGALIACLDRRLNREQDSFARRHALGVLALLIVLGVAGAAALVIEGLAGAAGAFALPLLALIASSLVAQRSLHEHVEVVARALEAEGLEAGRVAVARIVGRDVSALNEAGVARAAIESLAENFSDGVVAPLFFLALGGLAGGACYKAANTADSMIGYRSARHAAFGWAAARFDDLLNLIPARLSALWIVAAAALLHGADPARALRAIRRDARGHPSPNAGWPEAGFAGALGIRLGGPRRYAGAIVEDRWMGEGDDAPGADDILRALALYRRACLVNFAALAALALLISRG